MPKANTKKATRRTASQMVGFGTAVTNFWTGYFDFIGRATRAEFWFGLLFVFIVNWLFALFVGGIITTIVSAILFIPSLSLGVRRFRDAGFSVWWYIIPMFVIYFVPIICGASWYRMMAMDYVSSGMVLYSLFFLVFMVFCVVVACMPTKR